MKKEFKTVDEKLGIVQITTVDERWYSKSVKNPTTGLPEYKFVPSVTWIAEHYPKGVGFYKWLANKGWDESQALKEAAGDKGSRVHRAIDFLLDGNVVTMENEFSGSNGDDPRPLTLEEYECVMSFVAWFGKNKPKILRKEFVVFNDDYNYAGTVDLECELHGSKFIVDFKTSAQIWPSHKIQLSAYKLALDPEGDRVGYRLGILQLGYKKNQAGYKFTEFEDEWNLFLAAKEIWQFENKDKTPKQKDYPLEMKLTLET